MHKTDKNKLDQFREAGGALFNTRDLCVVDQNLLELVKKRAREASCGRYRMCLHHTPDDPAQEMLVAHRHDTYSRPHRHQRSMMFLLLEGAVSVLLFNDAGRVIEKLEMEPPGGSGAFLFRVSANTWYMEIARSRVTVHCEILDGPNPNGDATSYARWSPEEGDSTGIAAFYKQLGFAR